MPSYTPEKRHEITKEYFAIKGNKAEAVIARRAVLSRHGACAGSVFHWRKLGYEAGIPEGPTKRRARPASTTHAQSLHEVEEQLLEWLLAVESDLDLPKELVDRLLAHAARWKLKG